jgi:hypothetical protein
MEDVWNKQEILIGLKNLVLKPEGKLSLGKPRHRWVDNTKVSLKEIWYENVWNGSNWVSIRTRVGVK